MLHLLAQTDLAIDLRGLKKHGKCRVPSCLIGNFMSEYTSTKKLNIEPESIVKNYNAYGLQAIHDIDCGDFLRGLLYEIGEDKEHNPNQVKNQTLVSLEWKFECSNCNRFLTINVKDYVLKISISEEKSLEKLIEEFLQVKKCPCGNTCKVNPKVKQLGKYLYLEIDRSVVIAEDSEDQTSKEIRLFSLKLQPSYTLFGFKYACFGTVSYMLEEEDGGHYVTYLFPSSNECLKIHETEAKCQWRRPDFDTETVLVALQQIGKH